MVNLVEEKNKFSSTQDFQIINLEYLRNHRFLLGDVYLKSKSSNKRFLLYRTGEYLTEYQLDSMKEKNIDSFEFYEVIKKEMYLPWVNVLNEIKFSFDTPEKLEEIRQNLKRFYVENFIKIDLTPIVIDSIIFAHIKVMSEKKGQTVVQEFAQRSLELFKRQSILASASIIPLFLMGHDDFEFLVDVFHSVLLCPVSVWGEYSSVLDSGLEVIHDKPLSYKVLEKMPHFKSIKNEIDNLAKYSFAKMNTDKIYKFDFEVAALLIERHLEWCLGDTNEFNSELINDWMSTIFIFDLLIPFHILDEFNLKSRVKLINHEQREIIEKLSKVALYLEEVLALPFMKSTPVSKVAG